MIQVFSSGGGTQSTAIAVLILNGKLPKPDLVVIADTGRECSETWDYFETITKPQLLRQQIPVYRVGHEWFNVPLHGMDYVSHNGNTCLLGAWTNSTGKPGKLPGFCPTKWKQVPISRFLSRQLGIKPSTTVRWIGFSADEWKRAQRIMTSVEGKKGQIRLPLIQDVPMSRIEATETVVRAGWPMPPRSRCYICPNQGDAEWNDLKYRFPKEFQAAIDFENQLQQYDAFLWLHKRCVPLGNVDLSVKPTLLDSQYCDSGVCFV